MPARGNGVDGDLRVEHSAFLVGLDLVGAIAEAGEFEQTEAVKAFRERIRRRRG